LFHFNALHWRALSQGEFRRWNDRLRCLTFIHYFYTQARIA
jgi:hypothetical protein